MFAVGQIDSQTMAKPARRVYVAIVSIGRVCRKTTFREQKRPDDTPLIYLYRLIVAGIRAKPQVKDGSLHIRRGHVMRFFETLNYSNLAKQLMLLGHKDVDALDDTLQKYKRMQARQKKAAMGLTNFG